jgi:hypothetical protein
MNVITINSETNLLCFFTNEQLEEKRTALEDCCLRMKNKYGSNMSDPFYKICVINRRRITKELKGRIKNENNRR